MTGFDKLTGVVETMCQNALRLLIGTMIDLQETFSHFYNKFFFQCFSIFFRDVDSAKWPELNKAPTQQSFSMIFYYLKEIRNYNRKLFLFPLQK